MNKTVIWASYANDSKGEDRLIVKLQENFEFSSIPRLKTKRRFILFVWVFCYFLMAFHPFNIRPIYKTIAEDWKWVSRFNTIPTLIYRIVYFISRVGWIQFRIKNSSIVLFRGVNDPLITYLSLRYKNRHYSIILPHGTDFKEPSHSHWKVAHSWCTNYKNLNLKQKGVATPTIGRLDFYNCFHEVTNKMTKKAVVKSVAFIMPHINNEILLRTIDICEYLENNLSNLEIQVRLHPGNHRLAEKHQSKYINRRDSLVQVIQKNDIIFCPQGMYGWISNVFYQALMMGALAIPLKTTSEPIANLPEEFLVEFIEFNKNKLYDFINIGVSNYECLEYDRFFVNSREFDEKLINYLKGF